MRYTTSQRRTSLLVTGCAVIGCLATASAAGARHAQSRPRRPLSDVAATRYFMEQVFNRGHLWVADRLLSPRFVDHNPLPGQQPGAAGMKAAVLQLRRAFPDLHIVVQDVIGSHGLVAIRSTMYGTQRGEFMGIPPTGRRVVVPGLDMVRIRHGRATEHWGYLDQDLMMKQLGVNPAGHGG